MVDVMRQSVMRPSFHSISSMINPPMLSVLSSQEHRQENINARLRNTCFAFMKCICFSVFMEFTPRCCRRNCRMRQRLILLRQPETWMEYPSILYIQQVVGWRQDLPLWHRRNSRWPIFRILWSRISHCSFSIDVITAVTYIIYKLFTYVQILSKDMFLNQIWLLVLCAVCVLGFGVYLRFFKKQKLSRKATIIAVPAVKFRGLRPDDLPDILVKTVNRFGTVNMVQLFLHRLFNTGMILNIGLLVYLRIFSWGPVHPIPHRAVHHIFSDAGNMGHG